MSADADDLEVAPAARYAGRVGLSLLVVLGAALPYLLLYLLVSQSWQPLVNLDIAVEADAHRAVLDSDVLRAAAFGATFLGGGGVRAVVTLALSAVLLATRRARLAVFLLVTVSAGAVLNVLLKALVNRARPLFPDAVSTEGSSSFPSGHTMGTTVLVASLLLLAWPSLSRRSRPLVTLLAALAVVAVAASRVLLGVHYLSDVVAAVFAGIVWVTVSTVAFLGWRADRGRRPSVTRPGVAGGPGPPGAA